MGCANFRRMEFDMPMICGRTYGQMAEEYKREFDEEFSDELYYIHQSEAFDDAAELAEEFTKGLTFHDVSVISGHYDGFQFYVEERYGNTFDLDKSSRYCIDNEDAHYYFDMFRSQALRKADAEKNRIRKWLMSLKSRGYNIVVCTGRFSNGEATYSIATPRAQMIAAARA